MNKKTPVYRICILSREKLLKEEMFRIALVNNQVIIDKKQNLGGRGVYLKKDLSTILKAQERHSLSRGLKREVKDEIYLELIQELSKEKR